MLGILSVKIYKFSTTIRSDDRKVFYRPTVGSCACRYVHVRMNFFIFAVHAVYLIFDLCFIIAVQILLHSCRQGHDRQPDLLFNLDNKNLFCYGFLLDYLHLMLEGRTHWMPICELPSVHTTLKAKQRVLSWLCLEEHGIILLNSSALISKLPSSAQFGDSTQKLLCAMAPSLAFAKIS